MTDVMTMKYHRILEILWALTSRRPRTRIILCQLGGISSRRGVQGTRKMGMNFLLGHLLMAFVASSVCPTPLKSSLDGKHNSTIVNSSTRRQRKVPDTSYALPEDIGLKLDLSEPEKIYNQTDQSSYDGKFSYSFAAENGISVEVKGSQRTIGDKTGQVMEGRYSYTAPDGTPVAVQWYADETGYHATILNQAN